jgi:hypothetical protein
MLSMTSSNTERLEARKEASVKDEEQRNVCEERGRGTVEGRMKAIFF